jgi:hypothetical protein
VAARHSHEAVACAGVHVTWHPRAGRKPPDTLDRLSEQPRPDPRSGTRAQCTSSNPSGGFDAIRERISRRGCQRRRQEGEGPRNRSPSRQLCRYIAMLEIRDRIGKVSILAEIVLVVARRRVCTVVGPGQRPGQRRARIRQADTKPQPRARLRNTPRRCQRRKWLTR